MGPLSITQIAFGRHESNTNRVDVKNEAQQKSLCISLKWPHIILSLPWGEVRLTFVITPLHFQIPTTTVSAFQMLLHKVLSEL